MTWFRFYGEVIDDDKVQLLSGELFKFWVNCLCLASLNSAGILPAEKTIAWRLRLPVEQTHAHLDALVGAGLLERHSHGDGDGLMPHNWQGRQYQSDNSTLRTNAYRKRMKAAGSTTTSYLKHRPLLMVRDGSACAYCGSTKQLCLDHMVPVLLGGDDHPDNLAIACKGCNSAKSGRTPEQAGFAFVSRATMDAYTASRERLGMIAVTSTVSVTPPEQSRADTEQSRAEARAADHLWEEFARLYPAHRFDADFANQMWQSRFEDAGLIVLGLEAALKSADWTDKGGKFVPLASKFIGEQKYKLAYKPGPPKIDWENI